MDLNNSSFIKLLKPLSAYMTLFSALEINDNKTDNNLISLTFALDV